MEQDSRSQVTPRGSSGESFGPEPNDDSVLDAVFDVVTAWVALGLDTAKRGLEGGARWLEAQAKVVGDLAVRIAHRPGT